MYTKPEHALLDSVISKTGAIRNDADLARALEVAPPILSKIRHGRPVGDGLRLKFMRTFGVTWQRVDQLAPPTGKEPA